MDKCCCQFCKGCVECFLLIGCITTCRPPYESPYDNHHEKCSDYCADECCCCGCCKAQKSIEIIDDTFQETTQAPYPIANEEIVGL